MSAGTRQPLRVHWFAELPSTNDEARAAALVGAPGGTWYTARMQTAGRGRQGRNWASPPGNFYGSLLLRPERDLASLGTLSLVAGLAVAAAIHELTDGRLAPRLKWPNDVLLGGAKMAGVLLESGHNAKPSPDSPWVVIGIGVNLAHHPDLPDARATTSLAAAGGGLITPDTFLAALNDAMTQRLAIWATDGFAALRQAWLDIAAGYGTDVTLRIGREVEQGRFVDLGADGSLAIEAPDGRLRRFNAGEVFFTGAEAPPLTRRNAAIAD